MEPAEPAFAGIGLWFAVPFVSNGEWSVARRSLPQLGPAHVELRACRIFASLLLRPAHIDSNSSRMPNIQIF